jgi:hypothetical protein
MPDIKSSQNISITGSRGVSISDVTHVVKVGHLENGVGDEIIHIFAKLMQEANALPEGSERGVAQSAVEELEAEAHKGEEADENTVREWLNFLLEAAPDVWQVAVDTFINPIKGLSTVFQKVAERAKAEREAKSPTAK